MVLPLYKIIPLFIKHCQQEVYTSCWESLCLELYIINMIHKATTFYKRLKEAFIMTNSTPNFTGRNVPIKEIAKATGKDPQFIRIGIQRGIFNFGYAFKRDGSSEYNYLCPDKKVWEELGYFKDVSNNT